MMEVWWIVPLRHPRCTVTVLQCTIYMLHFNTHACHHDNSHLSIFSDKNTIEEHQLALEIVWICFLLKFSLWGRFNSSWVGSKDNLLEFACFVSTATTYLEIVNKVTRFHEIIQNLHRFTCLRNNLEPAAQKHKFKKVYSFRKDVCQTLIVLKVYC